MVNDGKFRYVNETVGVFILTVLIVISVSIFFMARAQRWIQPDTTVNILLPHEGSFGLKQGADVRVLGTIVGKVKNIYIDENDRMHAIINIQEDFSRFIRVDSVALIRKQFGVAGDSFLDIARGEGELLQFEQSFIVAEADRAPTETIQEAIEEIRNEFLPLIRDFRSGVNEWAKLAEDIRNRESGLLGLVDQGYKIIESIEKQEGLLGRLINDPKLADDFEDILTKLTEVTKDIEVGVDSFRKASESTVEITTGINKEVRELEGIATSAREVVEEITATVKEIRSTTKNVDGLVDSLDSSVDSFPEVLQQSNETLREIEKLVEALQRHWLIRKYVEEELPSSRIMPSDTVPVGGQP